MFGYTRGIFGYKKRPRKAGFALPSWIEFYNGDVNCLYGIAWSGSEFVLVGNIGIAQASPDGYGWSVIDTGLGIGSTLYGVTYYLSEYIAVGASGVIVASSDAVTWATRTSGVSAILRDITHNGSILVAVGNSGTIITSPDGVNWTSRTSGTTKTLYKVFWDGTNFIAIGGSGTILVSTDGINWSPRSSGVTTGLRGIAKGTSLYVIVGSADLDGDELSTILTSPNGIDWTRRTCQNESNLLSVVPVGPGFLAVGSKNYAVYSPDGINWSPGTVEEAEGISNLNRIFWSGQCYVIAGDHGKVFTSTPVQSNPNMLPNPDFETDLAGWNAANGATLTRDTTEAYSGSASMKIVTPAVRDLEGAVTDNIAVEPGKLYTASAYVKGTPGHEIRIEISNNVDRNAYETLLLTGRWQKLSVQFTTISETQLVMVLGTVNVTKTTFHVDKCKFEKGSLTN